MRLFDYLIPEKHKRLFLCGSENIEARVAIMYFRRREGMVILILADFRMSGEHSSSSGALFEPEGGVCASCLKQAAQARQENQRIRRVSPPGAVRYTIPPVVQNFTSIFLKSLLGLFSFVCYNG